MNEGRLEKVLQSEDLPYARKRNIEYAEHLYDTSIGKGKKSETMLGIERKHINQMSPEQKEAVYIDIVSIYEYLESIVRNLSPSPPNHFVESVVLREGKEDWKGSLYYFSLAVFFQREFMPNKLPNYEKPRRARIIRERLAVPLSLLNGGKSMKK